MANPCNIVNFPKPRAPDRNLPLEEPVALDLTRMFLNDIIDIAYDGLLHGREYDSVKRISQLIPRQPR